MGGIFSTGAAKNWGDENEANKYINIIVDENYKNNLIGKTNLILAAENGSNEIVQMLLRSPITDVNAKDEQDGRTALIWAAENGHFEVVDSLLKCPHVDVNVKDKSGKSALLLAAINGDADVVDSLFEGGREEREHHRIDANIRNQDGMTALMLASEFGHDDVVELMLKYTDIVDVNAKTNHYGGSTALLVAALNAHVKVVEMLLHVPGIDIKAKDDFGRSAECVVYESMMMTNEHDHHHHDKPKLSSFAKSLVTSSMHYAVRADLLRVLYGCNILVLRTVPTHTHTHVHVPTHVQTVSTSSAPLLANTSFVSNSSSFSDNFIPDGINIIPQEASSSVVTFFKSHKLLLAMLEYIH